MGSWVRDVATPLPWRHVPDVAKAGVAPGQGSPLKRGDKVTNEQANLIADALNRLSVSILAAALVRESHDTYPMTCLQNADVGLQSSPTPPYRLPEENEST